VDNDILTHFFSHF